MGRPLIASPLKRNCSVQIYLNYQQYRIISRVAFKADKHISQFLRELALKEIEKEAQS
jgi:hypothetical protein